jgi:hypothetical protein
MSNSQNIEYNGFCYLREFLQNANIQVEKSCEGAKADFAIRPRFFQKLRQHNKWIPVQLKATNKPTEKGTYKFSLKQKNYKFMLLALVCCSDKRIWLVPAHEVENLHTLQIGKTWSRLKHYEITMKNPDAIYRIIQSYYVDTINVKVNSLENIQRPVSMSQQREQHYRKMREDKFIDKDIMFDYPENEGMPYDFKVNTFTVQEKVATICKQKFTYSVTMRRSSSNKIKKYYKIGDANYYWFQIPNTSKCFIFKEHVLVARQYIQNNNIDIPLKSCLSLNIQNPNKWYYQYMYDYDNPNDIQCIVEMFTNVDSSL